MPSHSEHASSFARKAEEFGAESEEGFRGEPQPALADQGRIPTYAEVLRLCAEVLAGFRPLDSSLVDPQTIRFFADLDVANTQVAVDDYPGSAEARSELRNYLRSLTVPQRQSLMERARAAVDKLGPWGA